jgi:hypothetical protein
MKGTLFAFVGLLLLQATALGQLTIPDVVKPYAKIVAGCDCIIPEGADVTFDWSFSQFVDYEVSKDTYKAYLWAPPGDHEADVLVVIREYKEILTLKVDPLDPNNRDKWTLVTTRILNAVDWQRFSKRFKISGTPGPGPVPGPDPPPPGPDPTPGPGPTPTDPLAKKIHGWLAAVPRQYYTKEKVLKFADVYSSVASRAVATSDVQNIEAFLNITKLDNAKVVNNDPIEAEAWRVPFFVPLGKETKALYDSRALQPNDVRGIAQLWNDISKALKAAVASGDKATSDFDLLAEVPLPQAPPTQITPTRVQQPPISQAEVADLQLWKDQLIEIRQRLLEVEPNQLHQLTEEERQRISRAGQQR